MKKALLCLAIMAIMVGSASAADWNFYGSARVSTFYTSSEAIDTPGSESNDQYEQGLQGNARIGADVKASDELVGRFEYGAGSGNPNIRVLYGEWNFGGGKFLVGQTYTPLNWFYSDQVFDDDNDLLAQGGIYSGREAMLQLTLGDFKVALLAPNRSISSDGTAVATSTEASIPGIEASYTLKLDMATFDLGGGWQKFDAQWGAQDQSVTSYVLALGGKTNFGAFYLGGNVYVGQNAGNMIAIDVDGTNNWADGFAALTADRVVDNDAFGVMLALGYTVNDMFNVEAGYGYVSTEYDYDTVEKDKAHSYYLNSTITMAPGVFVVPEIGVIDGNEAGDNETTYFGAKWQINF